MSTYPSPLAHELRRSPVSPPLSRDESRHNAFACNLCDRSYSRIDHLRRHTRSHTREKPFHCSICRKSFARIDLLRRHTANHTSVDGSERSQNGLPDLPPSSRVAQACLPCSASKLKCGQERPCRRCERKGIQCVSPVSTKKRVNSALTSKLSPKVHSRNPPDTEDFSRAVHAKEILNTNPPISNSELEAYGSSALTPSAWSSTISHPQEAVSPPNQWNANPRPWESSADLAPADRVPGTDLNNSSYADFLRDLIFAESSDASLQSNNAGLLPQAFSSRDLFDFGVDSNLDFDDLDLGWITSFNTSPMVQFNSLNSADGPLSDTFGQATDMQRGMDLGAQAFRKSLWRWAPGRQDHGHAEQVNLALTSVDIECATNLMDARGHQRLEHRSRDQILAMILGTCDPANVPRVLNAFPSPEFLDRFVYEFLQSQQSSKESWLHVPTFDLTQNRAELNGIIIAAGAIVSPISTVRKLGYALQEAVRASTHKLANNDATGTQDVQLLQTFALYLDLGLWSGNTRKMMLTECTNNGLITLLRRSGYFRCARDRPAAPKSDDDDQTLDTKWRIWVKAECSKRLAFRAIIHAVQSSIALLAQPLISHTEMSLELPHSSTLWHAPDARTWQSAYLEVFSQGTEIILPSLAQCVRNPELLTTVANRIDVELSITVILHSMWNLVAQYQQLGQIARIQLSDSICTSSLISSHMHQELLQLLDHFTFVAADAGIEGRLRPETVMLYELFLMNLHVSIEELQIFAGKYGAEEAQQVYPRLKTWFDGRKARQAVWHAGQIVKAAKSHDLTCVCDFQAIVLYHASLTLWVYGMIGYGSSNLRTGTLQTEYIFLDEEESPESRRFISIGRGTPVIGSFPSSVERSTAFACLSNPKAVMDSLTAVLAKGTNGGTESLPLLTENLTQLMSDLGHAAWTIGCH